MQAIGLGEETTIFCHEDMITFMHMEYIDLGWSLTVWDCGRMMDDIFVALSIYPPKVKTFHTHL